MKQEERQQIKKQYDKVIDCIDEAWYQTTQLQKKVETVKMRFYYKKAGNHSKTQEKYELYDEFEEFTQGIIDYLDNAKQNISLKELERFEVIKNES